MIRVFPARTKWTPSDDMAFIGDPPLFLPEGDHPVMISCTFTWHINECERLRRSWSRFYSNVQVGGPAYDDPGENFETGMFVKPGITITSRGCTKNCEWCLVPQREGWIRELPIKDGWDVADNNLLACSREHILNVFDMLRNQPEPIRFSGGLDSSMLQPWHIDQLKTIRLKYAWFACDYPGAIEDLAKAADLMDDFSIEKKRCYVLIGFNGETVKKAEKRLECVYRMGFLPQAMLYRGPEADKRQDQKWSKFVKKWSRPAIYRSAVKGP